MRAFPLLRKRLHETAGAQFDSSFQDQVLMMCLPEFIHCVDSLTNYSRCMSNFFFFCFCSSCGDYYYLLLVKIRYDLEIYSVFQDLLYKIYITSAACLLT